MTFYKLNVDLALADHLVLEVPTRAPRQLSDNCVAIAQEVDVELDMVTGLRKASAAYSTSIEPAVSHLARYVYLWHVRREYTSHLRHRRNFQGRANHDHKVNKISVMTDKPSVEVLRKILAKESNIRLHDSGDRNFFLFLIIRAVLPVSPLLPRLG